MKNLFLLLALSAATITTSLAQVRPGGALSSKDYPAGTNETRNGGFGIKGGVNFADIRGGDRKNYTDPQNYTSFHGGFYFQFPFSNRFSIQPELLYSRQGFKGASPASTNTATNYTTRLDYIQMPVLLVFNVLDNVSLHAGPQVSLLTKVKEGDLDRKIANEGNVYNYSYSSLDYGLSAGVEARVGPARVGGRYTAGFNEIVKEPTQAVQKSITDIKNGVFQVYVGVGFTN